jgi:hypothetical protein
VYSLNRISLTNHGEAIVRGLQKVYDRFGSACGISQSARELVDGGTEKGNGGVLSLEELPACAFAHGNIRRSWDIVLATAQDDTRINGNPLRRKPAQWIVRRGRLSGRRRLKVFA